MADSTRDVKIKVSSESKQFKDDINKWRNDLRLLELQYKKNAGVTESIAISQEKFKKGAETLAVALKQLENGSGRTATAQLGLWHAENRVNEGFKSLASTVTSIDGKMGGVSGKLREFYAGQKVGDRTMREGVSTLQMFSGVLGGDVGNAAAKAAGLFQQTEFAVNGLGIAAQSAGGKVGAMGASLLAIAGPLVGVATFIGTGTFLISKMRDETKSLEEQLYKLRVELGEVSKAEQYDVLLKKLHAAQTKETTVSTMNWLTALFSGRAAWQVMNRAQENANKTREIEIKTIQKEIEEFKKLNALKIDEITITGKAVSERLKLSEPEGITGKSFYGPPAPVWARLDVSERQGGRTRQGMYTPLFEESKKEVDVFESIAVSSFNRVGQTIGQTIGGALTHTFLGIGHTVVGQFIADLTSQLTSLAASGLFQGLLGLLPGGGGFLSGFLGAFGIGGESRASGGIIDEPVVGRGMRTGKMWTFGENGNERVIPNIGSMSMAKTGGSAPIIVNINGNFRYDRISWAAERGNQIRQARRA